MSRESITNQQRMVLIEGLTRKLNSLSGNNLLWLINGLNGIIDDLIKQKVYGTGSLIVTLEAGHIQQIEIVRRKRVLKTA